MKNIFPAQFVMVLVYVESCAIEYSSHQTHLAI